MPVSKAHEKSIFDRDKGICKICERKIGFIDGEIDHKIPKSRGGKDDLENLQWVCGACNKLKGNNRTSDEVRIIRGLRPRSFTVEWNLSGEVMPVPPYGSEDISGSESSSKLTIKQLDETNKVVLIGEMNGLLPEDNFRVFLHEPYVPHTHMPSRFQDNNKSPITIVTDKNGSRRWEIHLDIDDFPQRGVHSLSVWINKLNPNRTILISNNFEVEIR